jgi:hypothetical protein
MSGTVERGEKTTEPPDEGFAGVGDETGIRIGQEWGERGEPLSFSELYDRIDYDPSTNFSYHLKKLEGHFVSKTDDGYELGQVGNRVVQAVLSGTMTEAPLLERTHIDHRCEYCGAETEVSYTKGYLGLYCTECPGNTTEDVPSEFRGYLRAQPFPPAGLQGRSATEVHRAAFVWGNLQRLSLASDLCPICSAPLDTAMEVCDNHDPDEGLCETCDRRQMVSVTARCTNCIFEIESTLVLGNQVIDRDRSSVRAPSGLNLVDVSTAFVGDYSFFGLTSPVQGRRYRFEVGSQFGDLFYQTVLADYREYLFARPVTVALRGLHFGRYGADAEDSRLTPQFLGNGTLIRGYGFSSFDPQECGTDPGACPVFDRLIGSRTAIGSAEVRVPVLGVRELGLISFPYLPTELIAFVDGGVAWSSDEPPTFAFDRESDERIPVFSTGLSTRVNVLGALILELSYAFPFQRPDKGWHFDFQISPGW